ncbi:MAG: hypothetical protein AAF517_03565 [Planctomycetota bacterium]
MASTKRRTLIATLSLVGLAVAAAVSYDIYRTNRYLRVAEAPRIVGDSQLKATWQIDTTIHGSLLRPKHGKFRGWYLSVDPNSRPLQLPPQTKWRGLGNRIKISGRWEKSRDGLILTERPIETSYWKVEEAKQLVRFVQAQGPFERWVLDGLRFPNPRQNKDRASRWELRLTEPGSTGASWEIRETDNGQLIRLHSTPGEFYLETDSNVKIETRDLWEEPEPVPQAEPDDVFIYSTNDPTVW